MLERDPGRRRPLRLLRPAAELIVAEARQLGGAAPLDIEPLSHGHRFSTRGVWRVTWSGTSAILKVISPNLGLRGLPQTHFRWWRREAEVLKAGPPATYAAAGISAPRLLRLVERADGDLALWLEPAGGEPGFGWSGPEHVEAARRLGQAQGGRIEPEAWWSRGFLRDYLREWDAELDWAVLGSDAAWEQSLVRESWPPGFRSRLTSFLDLRPRLLEWLDRVPRTFCHLDFWPANLFFQADRLVAIDWAFAGEGALGEDVGNLLPDTAFDLALPADRVAELVEPVFQAYLDGLAAAGWAGDPRWVRLGMCASGVKYGWLPVAMLAQAGATSHAAYGGNLPADSARLYRERGRALEMLFGWAEQASRLASELAIG